MPTMLPSATCLIEKVSGASKAVCVMCFTGTLWARMPGGCLNFSAKSGEAEQSFG